MDEQLFRKKALDKISSPEGLNEYVKAAPLSIWLLLGAIIVFLIGVCCWGVLGRIDTVVNGIVYVKDGTAVAYVEDEDCGSITEGMTVTAGQVKYTVSSVSPTPIQLKEDSEENGFLLDYLNENSSDEWVREISLYPVDGRNLDDGVYKASILVESIKPFRFVTN